MDLLHLGALERRAKAEVEAPSSKRLKNLEAAAMLLNCGVWFPESGFGSPRFGVMVSFKLCSLPCMLVMFSQLSCHVD